MKVCEREMSGRLAAAGRCLAVVAAVGVCAAGLGGASANGGVVISDGQFNNADWTLIARPYGPGGGSGSGMQVLTGGAGDNGAARRTANVAGPNGSGSYNASIYTAYTYNPAGAGALTGLNVTFDARFLTGLSAIGPAVEQGGLMWFAGSTINTATWQTYSFTPTAVDWYLINPSGGVVGAGPDFSAAGAPMRFGYFTGNGTSAGGFAYENLGQVDNFRVSFVPTPGAAAVMGLLGVAGAVRRRR